MFSVAYNENTSSKIQSITDKYYGLPDLLLNEYFYNRSNSSVEFGSCENWFSSDQDYDNHIYYQPISTCGNILAYGIKNEYRDLIETEVTWNFGGIDEGETSSFGEGLNQLFDPYDEYSLLSLLDSYINPYDPYDPYNENYRQNPIGILEFRDFVLASILPTDEGNYNYSSPGLFHYNWLYKGKEWTINPGLSVPLYKYSKYHNYYYNSTMQDRYEDEIRYGSSIGLLCGFGEL